MPSFRRISSALLLLAAIAFTQLSSFAQEANPNVADFFKRLRAGDKLTVVAYGTSVTKYGAWVDLVQKWFDAKYPGQVTVVNSGGPGQNSTWGLASIQAEVLDHKPDWVFIEFAANDAHERFKLPVETARQNLDKMIGVIRQQNPRAVIVLQTMNAFWDCPKGFTTADTSRSRMEEYNENYRACAREDKLPIIDNYPDWVKFKKEHYDQFQVFLPDGTHPNKDGVRTVMWPNMEKFFDQASQ
ncbi:hypothetical protein BH09VER1_BH09VER1_27510 [soil metagenome]